MDTMTTEILSASPTRLLEATHRPHLEASGIAILTMFAMPFDVARAQYGAAVERGWVRRSMLDDRAFEQELGALERLSLGFLARRV